MLRRRSGDPSTEQLSRFALAAFDGAFVASQTDTGITLGRVLAPLPPALVAARRTLVNAPRT